MQLQLRDATAVKIPMYRHLIPFRATITNSKAFVIKGALSMILRTTRPAFSIGKNVLFAFALLLARCTSIAAAEDATDLLADAKATLSAHREHAAVPKDYAQCIYNLEKAQVLLENKGDSSSSLAQEVNSTLFWAKRFSNIEVSNELTKLRSVGGAPKTAPKTVAVAKPAAQGTIPEAENLAKAKAAYDDAERFAQSNAADPFATSLRWFQVSSQYAGTEYALNALEKAREAQGRLSESVSADAKPSRQGLERLETKAATPEFDLLRDGEKLEAAGKFEEALAKYKESVALKDTIPAERRMGHVHFKIAQKVEEKLIPQYQAMDKEYSEAYQKAYQVMGGNRFFNDRHPAWVAAKKKLENLRKEADGIANEAAAAQACFDKILKLAPDNKDFDAAAYSAVSMSRRPTVRLTARSYIKEFLKNYAPTDGTEQVTYEYCKSEFERLGK